MSGPYVRIATAADALRMPGHGQRLSSPDHLRAWQRMVLIEKGDMARPWPCVMPPLAFIYQGNWGTSCPHCAQRMFTHPEWRLACCIECGALCSSVIVPDNYRDIERVLLARPLRPTQNWTPPETLDALIAENEAHGIRE